MNGKVIIRDIPEDSINNNFLVVGENNIISTSHQPSIIAFQGMAIPSCQLNNENDTGSFSITIHNDTYNVNWEILEKNTGSGYTTVGVITTTRVAIHPVIAQSLVVDYEFSPDLPFDPDGIFFTVYNNTTYPDSFSLSYSTLTQNSTTIRISRTDISSSDEDEDEDCWLSALNKFNMVLFHNN